MDMSIVAISGRLTRDPEIRMSATGKSLCRFSLAINGRKESVIYVDCVAFGSLADLIAKYCVRGRQVNVTGRLSQSAWEKDGEKRSKLEVICDTVQFLGTKKEQSEPAGATASVDDIPF